MRRHLAEVASGVRSSGADLAGRAVRVGRLRRAVNAGAAALALVTATLAASGVLLRPQETPLNPYFGVAMLESTPLPESTDPAEPEVSSLPGVDGRLGWIGDEPGGDSSPGLVLATADRAGIGMRHVRGVTSAYQVGDGYVVAVGGDHPRLYWVTREAGPALLLGSLDALAVDGDRVSWRRGPELSVGTVSADGRLGERVDTEVPDPAPDPVGFVGDTVLLRYPTAGVGSPHWGVWPAAADPQPALSTTLTEVVGAMPDRGYAVGLAPADGGGQCLVLADVARDLAVSQSVCLPLLPVGDRPTSLSPDGRWLLGSTAGIVDIPGAENGAEPVAVLVDVPAALAGAPDAALVVEGGPVPVGGAVWVDAVTVLYPADGGVVELKPERLKAGIEGGTALLPHAGSPVVLVEVV